MRRLTDDEWLAQARARVAAGEGWESPLDPGPPPPEDAPLPPPAAAPGCAFPCPSCDDHPPLEVYRRFEAVSLEPLRYCTRCYGFWAAGDALSHGVRDPYDDHHAFRAAMAPPRCRSCGGRRFTPEGVCRGCDAPAAPYRCPSCGKPMARFREQGVTLDGCAPCRGTWFDTGEIARVHQIGPVQGLAASLIDEDAAADAPSPGALALDVLLRVFLPWLPF